MGGSTGWNVTSNPLGEDASNSLDVTSPKWKSVPGEQGRVVYHRHTTVSAWQ